MKIEIGAEREYSRTVYFEIPFDVFIKGNDYAGCVIKATYAEDNFYGHDEFLNLVWDNKPENLTDEELAKLESEIIEQAMGA